MHIDSFITYLKNEKRYSDHTLKAYMADLSQFADFLGEVVGKDSQLPDDPAIIRQWIVVLMEAGLTTRSIRRKVSSLSSLYRFSLRRGFCSQNPLEKINLPKTSRTLPVFIPEDKLDTLLDHSNFSDDFAGIRDRLILEFFYFTGMRRSELVQLSNADVDCNEMVIKVSGKGGKQRLIPVGRVLSASISKYLKCKNSSFGEGSPGDTFFVTIKNKKLYPELVYRIVRRYLGLVTSGSKVSPHILRHSFATHMLNNGADLNAIKELLGHANLSATQVYTHNSFKKLKKIYKQAHPRA